MTTDEKTRVDELRAAGQGYKKIARELGLSENTVKSYIRRSTEPVMPDDTVCPECGKKIINTPGHRQRKFCSANCRCEYWKDQQTERQTDPVQELRRGLYGLRAAWQEVLLPCVLHR